MDWRIKAAIQRVCAAMPVGGDALYYALQRRLGLLGQPDRPLMMLKVAASLVARLRRHSFDIRGKRVLEVGTGRRIDLPIGLYLVGALSIETYDLYRLLRPELVMAAIAGLDARREAVVATFADVADPDEVNRRLTALLGAPDIRTVLRVAGVEYHAPADATHLPRPAGSVDLHMSFTVLQQIPYGTIAAILREGTRLLAAGGLAWHQVDLSDQFARADSSISRSNFLRFNDAEWARITNNRFGYHNRLRAADYERLYGEVEHEILEWSADVDERSRSELAAGFPLAEQFRDQPVEVLATDTLRVLSRPAH